MRLRARLTMAIYAALFVSGLFASGVCYAEVIGLWLFEEDEGVEVEDLSGMGNNGKMHGADWVDGKFGKALEFDEVGDYVDVGGNMQPGKDITVVAWIYNYGTEKFGNIITRWYGGNNNSYKVNLFTGEELAFFIYDKDNTMFRINETANHPERSVGKEQWAHIAAVADSATKKMRIYLNGKEVGSLDYSGTIKQLASAATLGNKAGGPSTNQFLGIIDEMAVFDHVLTEQEIKNIMDKGLEVAVLGKPDMLVSQLYKLAITWAQLKSQH